MNEFVAKKVGEVMAFSLVGQEILEKGLGIADLIGADVVSRTRQQLARDYDTLLSEVPAEVQAIATAKAEATSEKLRKLADTYIGDEWDNPVEVLEWLGFFEGAAGVHLALIDGAATKLKDTTLDATAIAARSTHHELLHTVEDALKKVGSERA